MQTLITPDQREGVFFICSAQRTAENSHSRAYLFFPKKRGLQHRQCTMKASACVMLTPRMRQAKQLVKKNNQSE
jgi:hypothetical protein